MARKLDAYCDHCADVRVFTVLDPGSCKCQTCGHVQQTFAPLNKT